MSATPEERLGEQVLEKAIVQTTGTGRSMMLAGGGAAVGGVVGALAGSALSGTGSKGDLLGYRGRMFLLVGPTRVGFFKFGQGLLRASVGEVLGILRRDAIRGLTIGGGHLTTAFVLSLDDGTVLTLEAPRSEKGRIERIAAMFGPRPAEAGAPTLPPTAG